MKEVPLTQGKFAIVDDEDFERLNRFKWCAHFNGYSWYAVRSIRINNKIKLIRMHREIFGAPKSMQIDHINNDGLDNRKYNLRLCTHQQNQFNRHAHKDNRLGVKGVCWLENRHKFIARIMVNGKAINLGLFNILRDADSAYRKAEEQYFGEFARRSN